MLLMTSSGGRSPSANARTALRSWPMVAAACTPCPWTSPMTRASPSPDSTTSYQSPPTSIPAVPGR